ncbi:hypothetical protein [Acinetobacter calcoaceticus]|uniref:hypothetical protein n=1 Tax=Acinetobacter calcoaceticus TaxID=471 RepID=UPI00321A78DB
MSEDSVKEQLAETLRLSSEEYNKAKQKNEGIISKILNEFDAAEKYLNELKSGEHIEREALDENPDLLKNSYSLINGCLSYIEKLKTLISSVDIEHDDLSYLMTISVTLLNIEFEYYKENFFLLPKNLGNVHGGLVGIEAYIRTFNLDKARYNSIITHQIHHMLMDAERELEDFKALKNILKNLKSVDYYFEECEKYMSRHYTYLVLFLLTILVALTITVVSVCSEPKFFLDKFDYWFLKGSFVLVVITLVSYFIKQSSHYQSLADQANQTRLELQAFPTFITGVEKADEVAIRKELALKYFGREVDKTAHKDMSNLVSDQMKNTTEMVKAVTEVIKKLGSN